MYVENVFYRAICVEVIIFTLLPSKRRYFSRKVETVRTSTVGDNFYVITKIHRIFYRRQAIKQFSESFQYLANF